VTGLPNFLSSLRLGFVPVLLMLAYAGEAKIFLVCLIVSLLTDTFDGFLARRFNATTALGAKLDSYADLATTLAMPPCAWWLRPEVVRAEAVAIGLLLGLYVAAHGACLLKFRRVPCYHCWTGKVAATAAMIEFVILFAGGPGWTLWLLVPFVALASLEEIGITLVLREWRTDVPSLWHALKWRREADGVRRAAGGH
jgi:CDP-diacylglycerol--glycerol-3-phosphate 3-phosphatidyltransferase